MFLMKWWLNILLAGWLMVPMEASGQHFIGRHKTEVKELMKEERKDMHEDDMSVNKVYNTLKYVDRAGNQTMLFVFSEQDTCLYSKWMCDYAMLNAVMAELNSKYAQSAEDTWSYVHDHETYTISLKAGDWYFTLTTRKEQQKTKD